MQLARGLSGLPADSPHGPVEVVVVTQTPGRGYPDSSLPFRVVRRPSPLRLVRLLREASVVHLAGPSFLPLLLALLLRKAMVVEHHGFQTACPNGQMMHRPSELPCPGHFMAGRHLECWRCNAPDGWLQSFKMWLLTFPRRRLCRLVDVNITPTDWLGTVLQLPRQATIHHGVGIAPDTSARPTFSEVPIFAFLGRLVSTKGVRVLLEAAAQLKDRGRSVRLLMIGDGPERARLEARVRELQLGACVQFRGPLAAGALEEALAGVTAVVLPSLGGEVFGLAVAENMMCGRAVVVSELGSLAEVVGEAGLRFRPGDATELAERLQRILDDPAQLRGLGAKAKLRATSLFGLQRMIERHLSVYRKLA